MLFTVSNLLITSQYSPRTHGLAGGVFNTIAQIGNSLGLAITSIIASSVTIAKSRKISERNSPEMLWEGYKAAFWACFGVSMLALGVAAWGLRKVGRVGLKRE